MRYVSIMGVHKVGAGEGSDSLECSGAIRPQTFFGKNVRDEL